ncbi:MAG: hypothetical protein M3N26_11205 [Pseudomonadota bacterium]|nr:hypothetical protein [Pseudomonadota bacterium]
MPAVAGVAVATVLIGCRLLGAVASGPEVRAGGNIAAGAAGPGDASLAVRADWTGDEPSWARGGCAAVASIGGVEVGG